VTKILNYYRKITSKVKHLSSIWWQSDLLRNGAYIYIIAVMGVNFTAVFFHLIISRIIGPSSYGLLGSMIGMLSVLLVPISALQVSVTQATMRFNSEKPGQKASVRKLLSDSVIYSSLTAVLISFFIPNLDNYLKSSNSTPFIFIIVWIPLATATAVLQGYLIADLKFKEVGIATLVGNGIFRLVIGTLMVFLGFGVSGAMFGIVIAQTLTLMMLMINSVSLHAFINVPVKISLKFRESVLPIFGFLGLTCFIGIDTFYSRHVLQNFESGLYSAAATTAHLTFIVPATLGTIVFPFLAESGYKTSSGRKIFRQFLYLTITSELIIFVIILAAPNFLLRALYGVKYIGGSSILSILSLESLFIGVTMAMFLLQLAKKSQTTLFVWVPVVSAGAILSRFGHTMHSITVTMFFIGLFTLIFFTSLNFEFFKTHQVLHLE